ncbi:MAG: class I poly(R)-hydroxyalkanoic acid synthase [Burkholderiales bacterium]|nr:class I poly(R)-hydroxyalkanoic acid synthase [Burkholderiales bacterium]
MQSPKPNLDAFKDLFSFPSNLGQEKPWVQNTPSASSLQSFVQSIGETMQKAMSGLPIPTLTQLQQDYMRDATELYMGMLGNAVEKDGSKAPPVSSVISKDKRFQSKDWQDHGFFEYNAALYGLNSKYAMRLTEAVDLEPKEKTLLRYTVQQMVEAMSPANFLVTNPEAQKKLIETKGQSLAEGLGNVMADMEKGRISQTDEDAFEVGRNVATTAGSVIFENELFQLIQYKPKTEKVGSRPMLFVPPAINKFYILDLQPENSLLSFVIEQGFTLYLMSWCNPKEDQGHLEWDDYVEHGVLKAVDLVCELSGQETINALGFCIGGTILTTAAGVMAARKKQKIESLTLLACFVDFFDTGTLGIFVNQKQVKAREEAFANGGIMPGKDLGSAFSSLRPNDLIWNYVVSNYLKGEKPPAFDLLYWNADTTNLPGKMFAWYLRNCYLENNLVKRNRVKILGESLDLTKVDVPTFILSTKEDHIVPWVSSYRTTKVFSGETEFVLGASGHIAGVVNPPAKKKRSFWTDGDKSGDAKGWLETAQEHPGSWWEHWGQWLGRFKGDVKPAKAKLGNAKFKPIEDAPGRYVKVRSE